MRLNSGPGLPLPTGRAVEPGHRQDAAGGKREPYFFRAAQLASVTRTLRLRIDRRVREFADHIARRAGQDLMAVRRRVNDTVRDDDVHRGR